MPEMRFNIKCDPHGLSDVAIDTGENSHQHLMLAYGGGFDMFTLSPIPQCHQCVADAFQPA